MQTAKKQPKNNKQLYKSLISNLWLAKNLINIVFHLWKIQILHNLYMNSFIHNIYNITKRQTQDSVCLRDPLGPQTPSLFSVVLFVLSFANIRIILMDHESNERGDSDQLTCGVTDPCFPFLVVAVPDFLATVVTIQLSLAKPIPVEMKGLSRHNEHMLFVCAGELGRSQQRRRPILEENSALH